MHKPNMLSGLAKLYNDAGYDTFVMAISLIPDTDLDEIMTHLGIRISPQRQTNIDLFVNLVQKAAVAVIQPINTAMTVAEWSDLPLPNPAVGYEPVPPNKITPSKFNKLCAMVFNGTFKISLAILCFIGIMSFFGDYRLPPSKPTPSTLNVPNSPQPRLTPVRQDKDITQKEHVDRMFATHNALMAATERTFKKSPDRDKLLRGVNGTGTAAIPMYLSCGKLSKDFKTFKITDPECFAAQALSEYYSGIYHEHTERTVKSGQ